MLSLECSIDGESWSAAQLAQVEYARHLHVLHDLERRGAPLELSDEAIDLLDADAARELSVATRSALDLDHVRELYADQLRASERMWVHACDAPAEAGLRAAVADLTIGGLTLDDLRAGLADSRGPRHAYVRLHPEHFAMAERPGGLYIMETFGMYGGPTEMLVVADSAMPPPTEPTPGYEVFTSGYATVAGAELNMPVFHQIKPTSGGLSVKLRAFFPPRTPSSIVEGHRLHMAIEFWQLARSVSGRRGTTGPWGGA